MKRFKKLVTLAVLALAVAMIVSACSSSGGGGSSTGTTTSTGGGGGTVSTITTTAQGRQAASTSTQSASMSQGSGQTFRNLGNVGLSATGTDVSAFRISNTFKPTGALAKVEKSSAKFASSNAARAAARVVKNAVSAAKTSASLATSLSGTVVCTDGGSLSFIISVPTNSSFDGTITFNNCREDDSQISGDYRLTATDAGNSVSLNITLGTAATAFTILDYGPSYSGLIAETSMNAFSLTESVSFTGTSVSLDMKADGTLKYHDYYANEDYTIQFTNNFDQLVSLTTTGSVTATTGVTLGFTTNGDFREVWSSGSTTNSVTASFSALKLDLTVTSTYEEVKLDGQFSMTFTPDTYCMSGTFKFVTNTPIRADINTGKTYQGQVTINDVTVVTYNSDGTITVTTGATDPGKKYSGKAELENECPIAEMGNDDAPVSSGSTGTAVISSTSGSGVVATITLSWTGPNGSSTSDMDLHMNYYSTATPTAGAAGTWYVDWHRATSFPSTCTQPTGLILGTDAVDTNGDGICDIGLDIDDTDGFGPEHITATRLPAGYYVLSVNSYDLGLGNDASANVSVSIQIGSSVFGPFTNAFTTSDSEGTTAAAWFAVADMVVASNGNVTVQAHNANLQLWHDVTFGLAGPALRTKGIR